MAVLRDLLNEQQCGGVYHVAGWLIMTYVILMCVCHMWQQYSATAVNLQLFCVYRRMYRIRHVLLSNAVSRRSRMLSSMAYSNMCIISNGVAQSALAHVKISRNSVAAIACMLTMY